MGQSVGGGAGAGPAHASQRQGIACTCVCGAKHTQKSHPGRCNGAKHQRWPPCRYIERSVGADVFCVGENFVELRWNGSDLDRNQDSGTAKTVPLSIRAAAAVTDASFPPARAAAA